MISTSNSKASFGLTTFGVKLFVAAETNSGSTKITSFSVVTEIIFSLLTIVSPNSEVPVKVPSLTITSTLVSKPIPAVVVSITISPAFSSKVTGTVTSTPLTFKVT